MIGLIQLVKEAKVIVDQTTVGEITQGIVLFLGIENNDQSPQADRLLQKILNYRIFPDEQGRMNRSLRDMNGGLLIVSQFTLAADTQKGLRPSFTPAADPLIAKQIYDYFVRQAQQEHCNIATGIFGAYMHVALINDGPVTFILNS